MLVSMAYIYLKLYNIDSFINPKYDLILLEISYTIYIEVYWYKDKNTFNHVNQNICLQFSQNTILCNRQCTLTLIFINLIVGSLAQNTKIDTISILIPDMMLTSNKNAIFFKIRRVFCLCTLVARRIQFFTRKASGTCI